MAKKETRRNQKHKRFNTTSIPALAPKTLKKGRKRQAARRKPARKRQSAIAARLHARAWGMSHYFAMLLALGGLSALIFLFTSSSFQITNPVVQDNRYVDASQILSNATIDHTNIFTIDPDQIALQLTTLLPPVKEAHLKLMLPNQAVLSIIEREPVITYARKNQSYWVDAEGRVFAAGETRPDLPVLIDEDGSASPDGYYLDAGISQMMQQIAATIPGMNEFHYRNAYGLFFISPEGWRVYLGDSANVQTKLTLWQTIRQQLLQEKRQVKVVDLRYDRVYIQ